jgi:hypothetical protein
MADEAPTNLGNPGRPRSPRLERTNGVPPKRVCLDGDINWSEQDRQWDIRVNLLPGTEIGSFEDARKELEALLEIWKRWEKIKYCFVGGIEVGDNPSQDDFERFHVHVALILHTPNTRRAVVYSLRLSRALVGTRAGEPRSYYISKRNPFASFTGWRNHHSKEKTKVGQDYIACEFGEAPKEYGNQLIEKGGCGKMKQDDMLREIMQLFSQGKKDQAFQEYPALTLRYHGQITAMVKSRLELPTEIDHSKRMWIYGGPGTGKSAYVAWKFPKAFKKSLTKNEVLYWNGLDVDWHTHVYLEDIGPEAFENLGMEQLKQWADPSHGYTVSMKYGAPIYGVTLPLIVTSNYRPSQLLPDDLKYPTTELEALTRRFEIIHIDTLLQRENLKLRRKSELVALRKAKNADFSAVFEHLIDPDDAHVARKEAEFEF